mmetsp:Transcript_47280/g.110574  ORF Transcript_47280/g.110574 Transcript_47280/m.110574 type:complete len:269 (+) Transcript_47280:75-881(+)
MLPGLGMLVDCSLCAERDRELDTVRVRLPVDSKVLERWDAGDNRFVELHSGHRLVVGAATQAEADKLVDMWQERRHKSKAAAEFSKEAFHAAATPPADTEIVGPEPPVLDANEEMIAEEGLRRDQAQEVIVQEVASQDHAEQEQKQAELQKEEEELMRKQARAKERRRRVEEFLRANGFESLKHAKRVQDSCGLPFIARTMYPIHVAAESADAGIVEMMLQEGADPSQKTSNGKTASELARKRNKGGSHDAVLRVLTSKTASSHMGGA